MNTNLPIFERNGKFILQTTFAGVGQKQVTLGKDKKTAKTRAKRFIATAEINGFDCAKEELKGRQVLKKGDDPTFEQMKELYLSYLRKSGKTLDPRTIKTNTLRLKNVMDKGGFKTIGQIDKSRIWETWFKGINPTQSQACSHSSFFFGKCVFSGGWWFIGGDGVSGLRGRCESELFLLAACCCRL